VRSHPGVKFFPGVSRTDAVRCQGVRLNEAVFGLRVVITSSVNES
jgi:hypothetical protein